MRIARAGEESSQRSKGKSQKAKLRAAEGRHGGEVALAVLLVQVPERGLERRLLIDLLRGLERWLLRGLEQALLRGLGQGLERWLLRGLDRVLFLALLPVLCERRFRIPQNHRFRIPHPGGKESGLWMS